MTDRLAVLAERATEACRHAPALAARLAEAGLEPRDLARPGALDSLPVLGKARLMELQAADPPFAGFLSVPLSEVAQVFASPGPIFEPVLKGHEAHGFDLMFRAAGLGPGDVVLNTWSHHLVPAGLIFGAGAQAVGATVIPSGPGQTELQVQLIAQMGVTAFLGATAYFEKVAEAYAEARGATRGGWPLRHAFLGGEPGDWMAKRRRLEEAHGVVTHGAYGTADLGLVGYEDATCEGYRCHPERLVQICDPESGRPLPAGQPGEVVVTTLARGWPMIRFGTGDLARAPELAEDGFAARIGPIEGRAGAGVKVREIFVYPAHAEALAARLGPGTAARVVVWREAGQDRITLELSGAPRPEDEVVEAFRRITRLRADRVLWHDAMGEGKLLEDRREF
jgi:phenylacetate-CoA ligase